MISLEHGRKKLSGGDCSATIISKRHILTAAHSVIIGERINKNPDHERVSWVSAVLIEYHPKPLHERHRLHINFTENTI
uniref:Peptidase S1 domain-containing protein n=1 Tax=Panagrolaimus davidi TaxID=227884 RepID=A0A914PIW0_9BILA